MTVSAFQYDTPLVYDSDQIYDAYAATTTPNVVPSLPHLSATLSLLPDGSFAFWQQDTLDEVGQSVEMIVGSVPGERTVQPSFGMTPIVFTDPNIGTVLRAIELWENRAAVSVKSSMDATNTARINVAVALVKGSVF